MTEGRGAGDRGGPDTQAEERVRLRVAPAGVAPLPPPPWPGWLGPAALGVMTTVGAVPVAIILAVRIAGGLSPEDIDPATLIPASAALLWQLVADALCLAFLGWYLRRVRRLPPRRIGLGPTDRGWLLSAPIPIAAGCIVANVIYSGAFLLVKGELPEFLMTGMLTQLDSPAEIALAALLALLVAPLAEEAVFRLVIFGSLRRKLRPGAAIWLSALIFAAYHADPAAFVPLIILGVAFAWAYQRSGSILVAVITHVAFNVLGFASALLIPMD